MAKFGVVVFPRSGVQQDVKLLEEMGFDIALFPDTQILAREVYVTLASCVSYTHKIKLGSGVTNPFTRHPSVTASAIASLNELSGGRAILGVARGDSSVHRIGHSTVSLTQYRSYVEAVRGLLAGRVVEYNNARFQLEWLSQSVQRPVPVDMAASGPKNLALAGELGDRVSVWVGADPDYISQAVSTIKRGIERAHRDPAEVELGVYLGCFLADDPRQAREEMRGVAAIGTNFFADKNVRIEELPPLLATEVQKARAHYTLEGHGKSDSTHARLLSEAFIDWHCLVGSVEMCVERLRKIFAQGIRHVYLGVGSFGTSPEERWRVLKTFADRVMPHFK